MKQMRKNKVYMGRCLKNIKRVMNKQVRLVRQVR